MSLSGDVANETAEAFADALDARGVPLTHLLRPAAAPAELVAWVRERCARGDTLALHGFDHAPRPLGHGRRKGEFASLPRHEAGLRLTAARRALTAAALWTDVFVPPRWLASDGTVAALADQGFRVLVDDSGIRDLPTGAVLPGRVLGFRVGERLLGAEVAWDATARRTGADPRPGQGSAPSRPGEAALAAVDAALPHVTPTTYGRMPRRAA